MTHFADRLIERAVRIDSRVIVGLDPEVERFPVFLRERLRDEPTEERLEETLFAFNRAIIEVTAPMAVGYKPQAAFYEQYGTAGHIALRRTLMLLRDLEIPIIMDGKRNDVAHTAKAYATAWLATHHPVFKTPNPWRADALTINGYLGKDGVLPFLETNREAGLFVLAKTSNPSSGDLQDLELVSGGTVADKMAQLAEIWGRDSIGAYGYGNVGIVVGATYPETAARLRRVAPHALFLMPGIGAQGGSLQSVTVAAGPQGVGAYAASSRGVMYPFKPEELAGADWRAGLAGRVEEAARTLQTAVSKALVTTASG
ncbi:MAG: orotidine-5'-phosphate decarboxylase [Magnetococcales bacterium]|nr:orotidine-5'-phosphate decarboxylase [Magnetococcales bacterium]